LASKKIKENMQKAEVVTFSKQQVLSATRYKHSKDVLNVMLNDNQYYTLEEVDELIDKFMKGKVM